MSCSCNNHKPSSFNNYKPCSCNNHKPCSCNNHKPCSCNNHKKRSCDLQFYYNDDEAVSHISNIKFGSSVIQTIQGVLTDKSIVTLNHKTIGNFLQYNLCSLTANNTAFVSSVFTFYLKCGTIQCQPVGVQCLNSQGNYGLPHNVTKTYRIINGTEQYLNSTGYVVLHTCDNLERLVKIYFKTLKKPHSVFEI
jgi:hypothetical protein